MLDLARLPILTPEALLGSEPPLPPPGPVHLALPGLPERQQPTVLYECFARLGLGYLDPLPDAPFPTRKSPKQETLVKKPARWMKRPFPLKPTCMLPAESVCPLAR